MLLAGLLGDAAAAGYVGLILRLTVWKYLWVALLAGELTRAWAGTRWAKKRLGYPATTDQRARLALSYSLAVTGPLLVVASWFGKSRGWGAAAGNNGWNQLAYGAGTAIGTVVGAAAIVGMFSLLRYLLLTLFNPRR
jgi:hypothetical protein